MASFKPIKTTNKTSLDTIGVKKGQFIICEEEKRLYFDKNDTERILIGKDPGPSIPKLVTFADGTDEEIKAMLDAHYNGIINIADYWSIGDTRKIHLNEVANPKGSGDPWLAQDITIVITTINHHDLATPIGDITKAAVTCQTRECVNNIINAYNEKDKLIGWNLQLSGVGDYDKVHWTAIGMRTWGNESFYNIAIPTGVRNMIKPIKHNVLSTRGCAGTTNNGTPIRTVEKAIDNIFLPTYPEIFGNIANNYYLSGATPAGEEGTQWEYYKTSANRSKYANDNGVSNGKGYLWWIGSPNSSWNDSGGGWCCLDGDTLLFNKGYDASTYAPAFCL